jgi:hypothetical protein
MSSIRVLVLVLMMGFFISNAINLIQACDYDTCKYPLVCCGDFKGCVLIEDCDEYQDNLKIN